MALTGATAVVGKAGRSKAMARPDHFGPGEVGSSLALLIPHFLLRSSGCWVRKEFAVSGYKVMNSLRAHEIGIRRAEVAFDCLCMFWLSASGQDHQPVKRLSGNRE